MVSEIIQLSNPKSISIPDGETYGIRYKLVPVTTLLIIQVSKSVPVPKPPVVKVAPSDNPEEKDKSKWVDVENISDPDYIRSVQEADELRMRRTMEAYAMFGIQLLDQIVNADPSWILKLKFMEKHGALDLSEYDMNDLLEQEFLFKNYFISNPGVVQKITELSGVSLEGVKAAEDSFPSKT